ncbi:hypothetical protein BC938DRAFT_482136 [Jimgerdemannia flammicorona]|uniref:Uncharacterized protein n=1 Tax=Jimgerdemannia flammicorona TaxID=994334 RepID=A0A433QWQ9_9FUNG|nr:hypothetical protein BC938DRAFT_482136 [Jimgerdemannia flammicorona]
MDTPPKITQTTKRVILSEQSNGSNIDDLLSITEIYLEEKDPAEMAIVVVNRSPLDDTTPIASLQNYLLNSDDFARHERELDGNGMAEFNAYAIRRLNDYHAAPVALPVVRLVVAVLELGLRGARDALLTIRQKGQRL